MTVVSEGPATVSICTLFAEIIPSVVSAAATVPTPNPNSVANPAPPKTIRRVSVGSFTCSTNCSGVIPLSSMAFNNRSRVSLMFT